MQKIRVLIAKQDGCGGERPFAPGAIKPTANVPVTLDFDPRRPPLGIANIVVDGDEVYAECELADDVGVSGLVPALGGQAIDWNVDVGSVITTFAVQEASFCKGPNDDPRISQVVPGSATRA